MIAWILSKLFPFHEASYTVYRRETKKIPVMHKGISAFGMSAVHMWESPDEQQTTPMNLRMANPSGYLRRFEFRNTLMPGGSK